MAASVRANGSLVRNGNVVNALVCRPDVSSHPLIIWTRSRLRRRGHVMREPAVSVTFGGTQIPTHRHAVIVAMLSEIRTVKIRRLETESANTLTRRRVPVVPKVSFRAMASHNASRVFLRPRPQPALMRLPGHAVWCSPYLVDRADNP